MAQVMGLPVSVHVRLPDDDDTLAAGLFATFIAELQQVEELFSTYRPGSEISRMGRGELDLADAHPDVGTVLGLCALATERTAGWFDPWLPQPDGSLRLDPSGLVKGWAVERAARVFDALDADVCVNAGGDVLVRCADPASAPWRTGISDPADPTRIAEVVALRAGAVATSGTSARGAHIIDPHTGRPVERAGSVTVVGPSLLWADVYATAAFAQGPSSLEWLAAAGVQALFLGPDGRLATDGWTSAPRRVSTAG